MWLCRLCKRYVQTSTYSFYVLHVRNHQIRLYVFLKYFMHTCVETSSTATCRMTEMGKFFKHFNKYNRKTKNYQAYNIRRDQVAQRRIQSGLMQFAWLVLLEWHVHTMETAWSVCQACTYNYSAHSTQPNRTRVHPVWSGLMQAKKKYASPQRSSTSTLAIAGLQSARLKQIWAVSYTHKHPGSPCNPACALAKKTVTSLCN